MWSFFSRDPAKDFPYEIGEPIPYKSERFYWALHKGKKKANGDEVTIFLLDVKNSSPQIVDAAKASVKRLKTLRHPSILTFLDSAESDKAIYLATEAVEPLETYLEGKGNIQGDLAVSWGLFQVTRGLSFLINDGNLRHNNVNLSSVFVNSSGEWKLGGVDWVAPVDLSIPLSKVPSILSTLDPPELKSGGRPSSKWSYDSWGLGLLIWEVFNCPRSLRDVSLLRSNTENIPKTLATIYGELTSSGNRPNPADIIAKGRKATGYFKNDLVDTLLFLEEIQIKEQTEKQRFFTGLVTALDRFPQDICKHRILPQLINAYEFGNAGSAVLGPLFKLGKLLEEPDYQAKVVPCVVKLFSSTDRQTRVKLLQQLDNFADHLQPSTVNEKIFPNVVTGFMDTNPVVREHTVKAMLYLAPKLNYNNLNVELLRNFARLQVKDDQGGIRTNTTICLGKIACYLHPQTRKKILIPAFTRVFQDVFPQAKIAGILGLAATQQYYLMSEVSSRILPSLCPLTCDSDKSVRETAFKTIKGFLGKLEKLSEDPSLLATFEAEVESSSGPPSSVVLDAASTWAGWAVSALTNKFNRSLSAQSVNKMGGVGGPQGPHPHQGASRGSRYTFGTQSSSSTSTTTSSSIPSTPSVDRDVLQPTAEGQESTTDYDDTDWDNEDWGAIEGSGGGGGEGLGGSSSGLDSKRGSGASEGSLNTSSTSTSTTITPKANSGGGTDGWDTWAIEETDERDGWDDFPTESSSAPPPKDRDDDFFSATVTKNPQNVSNPSSDWSGSESTSTPSANNTTAPSSTTKLEEMRRRREERKLHRQNELQAKKASKPGSGSGGGPLKLGAKKIDPLQFQD